MTITVVRFQFILLIILQGCVASKSQLNQIGDSNDAIKNAILDFTRRCDKLAKADTVFNVTIVDFTDKIGVGIFGSPHKFHLIKNHFDSLDSLVLPTRYIEVNKKLFYWKDLNIILNHDIISKLQEYNKIDTVQSVAEIVFAVDDAKRGTDYFFCKDNLLKYKKVITTRAIGSYDPPKLNCGR